MTERRPLGAVLAGGAGRRLGGAKCATPVAGVALAERAARLVDAAADPVVLVTDDRKLAERLGRPRLSDRRPGMGPLAGLETALLEARSLARPGVVVLACDMPLVPSALLEAAAGAADDADAVLPGSSGPLGVEPLCGFYARSALPAVRDRLDDDFRSLEGLLSRLAVRRLEVEAFRSDPEVPLFLNVNTPAELERAETLLSKRGG